MSFLDSFTDNVRLYPEKIALEFIDPLLQRVTYAELDQLVQKTEGYLQNLGIQPGDRVGLQLTKSLEFILLHLAMIRLGAITLPLNLAYPPDEIEYFLSDSGAKIFFALESSKEKIQSILPRLPELQECIFLDPTEPEQFNSLISNLFNYCTLINLNPLRGDVADVEAMAELFGLSAHANTLGCISAQSVNCVRQVLSVIGKEAGWRACSAASNFQGMVACHAQGSWGGATFPSANKAEEVQQVPLPREPEPGAIFAPPVRNYRARAKEATEGVVEAIRWLDDVNGVILVMDATLDPFNQVNVTILGNLEARRLPVVIAANKIDLPEAQEKMRALKAGTRCSYFVRCPQLRSRRSRSALRAYSIDEIGATSISPASRRAFRSVGTPCTSSTSASSR